MKTQEIWKDVVGYEGIYQISNVGKLKSIERYVKFKNVLKFEKERLLKPSIDYKGYHRYSLCIFGSKINVSSHRLVALAFIENTFNKPFVNHINGIKNDNRVENLEWCTAKENTIHAVKNGFIKRNYGEKHHMSKVSNSESVDIRTKHKKGITIKELSNYYGLSEVAISNIIRFKTYKPTKIN